MIIIISCTNRKQSVSKKVSLYYQQLLTERGVNSRILDLEGLPIDFIHSALYENSGKNPAFNQYQEIIDAHEKFVFVVPEYNGSFPGVLKTFIDGLRYPDSFRNKKAALVGLSSGMQGGALALSHLNDILSYLGTDVLGLRVKLHQIGANLENGRISNKIFNQFIEQQIQKLLDF
ncbi:MAG: NAD(P)H-dependent oxidoreductase [Microscillaceae bacterium]|nr:NAD(P)H-dependent oxidoreductase [Microscillaceae bacterium]